MAISKIGSKALVDCSVAAVDIADNSITAAKLAGSIANAKLANSSVTINSTSVSLGGSANINALDWQSVIVADGSTGTTGVAGRGYFINTTSAAHTFTLPVSATRGDTIAIKDYAGTFATFNLTINRNGHKIQGVENNSLISTNRASVVLVYVDVTRGWEFTTESNVANLGTPLFITATGGTITTSGNFKIHSFTGDGSFVVSQVGNSPVVPTGGPANVDYLVVAGGGGGGPSIGGGGGAGGHRTTFPSPGCNAGSFPISATTFPIIVGAGGGALTNGNPSVFSTITSTGGGAGGYFPTAGQPGGSGGGGAGECNPASVGGGTGNTPPVSPPQGNSGGNTTPAPTSGGSGGGGISTVGTGATGDPGGAGGSGTANSITGSSVTRAGGGGGNSRSGEFGTAGAAGPGGGGKGRGTGTGSDNGTVNTGGGGGGGPSPTPGPSPASSGGSGIVIIRYKFQ